MSCPQDIYYLTDSALDASARCGAIGASYQTCQPIGSSGTGQPSCCPVGWHYSGNKTPAGSCTFGLLNTPGQVFKCFPNEPSMDGTAKLNCCLGINLPNNSANDYCATGWCPESANCSSFMNDYCRRNLLSPYCEQYSNSQIYSSNRSQVPAPPPGPAPAPPPGPAPAQYL